MSCTRSQGMHTYGTGTGTSAKLAITGPRSILLVTSVLHSAQCPHASTATSTTAPFTPRVFMLSFMSLC